MSDSGKNQDLDSLFPKPKQTEVLGDPLGQPMKTRSPLPGTTQLSTGWNMVCTIDDQKVEIPLQETMIIGRSMDGDNVEFDLTPHGAYHFGVSRKHAKLTLHDGYLYVEDLESTNGTRINGFQLSSKQKYRLRNNDEVEFARLRIQIRFEKVPR